MTFDWIFLFIQCQSESTVNPESFQEAKSSQGKESGDKEALSDVEATTAEVNENTGPIESRLLGEGGKKDSNVRRQELLVDSGLAEVCCFSF